MLERKQPGFIEVEVNIQPNVEYDRAFSSKKDIYLDFDDEVNPKELPYSEIFTPTELDKIHAKRINHSILVARGDSTPVETIQERGGFHPPATISDNYKNPEYVLDVLSHRIKSEGSGLVSCTSSMRVAKAFGGIEGGGYVYLVKAKGAISPTNIINQYESEFSVPGGIDFQDIVAYRQLGGSRQHDRFEGSSIFIREDFVKKYPQLIQKIVNAFLENNEKCLSPLLETNQKKSNFTPTFFKKMANKFSSLKNKVEDKVSEEIKIIKKGK